MRFFAAALFALVMTAQPAAAKYRPQERAQAQCVLQRSGAQFIGGCGRIFDRVPRMTLASAASVGNGIWSRKEAPQAVWSGDMTDEGYPNAPLELEIYAGGRGILRNDYYWVPVTGFTASESALRFSVNAQVEVAPDTLDRLIVEHAADLIADPPLWSRAATRTCAPDAKTFTLYCALREASIEITGGFDHRRPALQLVREAIDEQAKSASYHHPLMDFDSDPGTTFSAVQGVLTTAMQHANDPRWLAANGFLAPLPQGTNGDAAIDEHIAAAMSRLRRFEVSRNADDIHTAIVDLQIAGNHHEMTLEAFVADRRRLAFAYATVFRAIERAYDASYDPMAKDNVPVSPCAQTPPDYRGGIPCPKLSQIDNPKIRAEYAKAIQKNDDNIKRANVYLGWLRIDDQAMAIFEATFNQLSRVQPCGVSDDSGALRAIFQSAALSTRHMARIEEVLQGPPVRCPQP